ncbi:ATP synthase gamma chain [Clostridia bacterium]|nr:ATP synthase gamma chain [Clostridia bacterium]
MKNLADIKYRIKGISQTRQITGAMETISIAKMRRAMQRFNGNQIYFHKVRDAVGRIIRHSQSVEHRYFKPKAGNRAIYVVIASDKGLAGGYNNNLLNFAWKRMQESDHAERYIFTVGQMAREYFERRRAPIDVEFMHVTYNPSLGDAVRIVDTIVNLYEKNFMDEVYAVYTALENSSTMRPEILKLLPLEPTEIADGADKSEDYFRELYYDPSPEQVLEVLVPQYLTGIIYGCLIQSVAAEHSSRVLAMSSARRNATGILDRLNVVYNRARQEAVTNEMIEIITSASSVQ